MNNTQTITIRAFKRSQDTENSQAQTNSQAEYTRQQLQFTIYRRRTALFIVFRERVLAVGHRSGSRRRMEGRIRERVHERMDERWEQMTPEERERFREG